MALFPTQESDCSHPLKDDPDVAARACEVFEREQEREKGIVDRLLICLLAGQALVAVALAFAPIIRGGTLVENSNRVAICLLGGAALVGFPALLMWRHARRPLTRHVGAAAQTLMCCLLAVLSSGRLEIHFFLAASCPRACGLCRTSAFPVGTRPVGAQAGACQCGFFGDAELSKWTSEF